MEKSTTLNIQIPQSLADQLAARRKRWLVSTSAFVRFCVEQELRREAAADAKGLFSDSPNTKFPPVKDSDTIERRSTSAPAVLITPRPQEQTE